VFSDSQHSRLPVYGETLDDPQGFVHVRDVMSLLAPDAEGGARQVSDHLLGRIKRDILFVPQSMTLSHCSCACNPAASIWRWSWTNTAPDGLVSMEDLVSRSWARSMTARCQRQ
jgi:hypothetical protein